MKNLFDIFQKGKEQDYPRLFHDHYPFVQKQCHVIAAKMNSPGGTDALVDFDGDTLTNRVLDRLTADDYKVLRNFAGRSKITTYLITIIQNEAYDLRRQMTGRDRSGERAQKLGAVAEMLHDLVYKRGYNLPAAKEYIESALGIAAPLSSLEGMLAQIRGRGLLHHGFCGHGEYPLTATEITTGEGRQTVLIDSGKNPEDTLCDGERKAAADKMLANLLAELTGEERLMLKMRFPGEDEKPKTMGEIADILGTSEKAVDGRIRRILLKCRETMLKSGLGLSDVVNM